MLIKKLIFVLGCILYLSTESTFGHSLDLKESDVFFGGPITREAVAKFIADNDKKQFSNLIISSNGGDVHAGLEFGEWIRRKNIDVTVRLACISACANYVFPAGRRRIIEPGAIVLWHGGMDQKNLRDNVSYYEYLNGIKTSGERNLTATENSYLQDEEYAYTKLKELQDREHKFYADLGIDNKILTLGQEPIRLESDAWTATVPAMNKFGILEITAPNNYGKFSYVAKLVLARFLNKMIPASFDLNNNGDIELVKTTVSDEKN